MPISSSGATTRAQQHASGSGTRRAARSGRSAWCRGAAASRRSASTAVAPPTSAPSAARRLGGVADLRDQRRRPPSSTGRASAIGLQQDDVRTSPAPALDRRPTPGTPATALLHGVDLAQQVGDDDVGRARWRRSGTTRSSSFWPCDRLDLAAERVAAASGRSLKFSRPSDSTSSSATTPTQTRRGRARDALAEPPPEPVRLARRRRRRTRGMNGQNAQRPKIDEQRGQQREHRDHRDARCRCAPIGPRPAVPLTSASVRHSSAAMTVRPEAKIAGPGGAQRERHRLVLVLVAAQLLAVAGDEQQRVVGAGAEHEHRAGSTTTGR